MMEAKEEGDGWTVEGELGRGSFGSVYLLIHKQAGQPASVTKFALKVIDEHGARKADREEARKELRIMRGLFHPHIVDLVDAFELQQQIHLVLELCEGGDLRTYLDQLRKRRAREKRPTAGVEESLVLSWTKQLASALAYLHHKKILHRDLKPQNIFLKDRYNLKVGDLGIARQLRFTLEMAATHIGTPLYISPEIYQGTPYSYKADIWSLGCCVYEMLALQCAFQAASRYEVMWKVVSKELGPVPQCYGPDLRALTISMLQKDPESRPSATDVHATVQSLLQQERPPWEKRTPKEKPPSRPADARALQTWRQNMANALIKYLSQKHAIHSAGLAELMLRLSQGSIHGTEDTDLSASIPPSQIDASSVYGRENSASSSEYHYSSDSFTGSESEADMTVTLDSSAGTVTGASVDSSLTETSDFDLTQKTQISRGASRRSAFKVRHGPSPDVKRKKTSEGDRHAFGKDTERQLDTDEDRLMYVSGNIREVLSPTDSSRHPPDWHRSHENARFGKLATPLKPRPLPNPRAYAEPEHKIESLAPLSIITGHETGDGATSSPDGNPDVLLPLQDLPADAKHDDLYFPLPPADQTEAHAAYAKEVTRWARAHLFSADRAEATPGGDAAEVPAEMLEQRAGDGDELADDVQQILSKGERSRRKKRNFLKERKNKQQGTRTSQEQHPDVEAVSEARHKLHVTPKPACAKAAERFAELEDGGVTLFTRGQRVTFTSMRNSSPPAETSEVASENQTASRSEMERELGETVFQVALNAASLLSNRPSLLEIQLRDLLGRENCKKYAAAIVECATADKEAS